jgi:hypothetical protein
LHADHDVLGALVPGLLACQRFLRPREVAFEEIEIDQHADAAQLVLRENGGRRRLPIV